MANLPIVQSDQTFRAWHARLVVLFAGPGFSRFLLAARSLQVGRQTREVRMKGKPPVVSAQALGKLYSFPEATRPIESL